MPRYARKASSTDVYHVMARGASRQLIFEDDIDRKKFLSLLSEHANRNEMSIFAYCLMGNHVHLLVQDPCKKLSRAMKNIFASYASWFNLRHGRCGHLFQGRFKSEPVENDSYLLSVVRYIHKNPMAAGLAEAKDWQWSSFHEYAECPTFVSTDLVLDLLDGKDGFLSFHEKDDDDVSALDVKETPARMADEDALALANKLLGKDIVQTLKGADRQSRNAALRILKANKLGVRQIQRLTGISLSVISKA